MIIRNFCFALQVSLRHGILWFRLRVTGPGFAIQCPWKPPLFSERNGLRRMIGAFGWRAELLSEVKPEVKW